MCCRCITNRCSLPTLGPWLPLSVLCCPVSEWSVQHHRQLSAVTHMVPGRAGGLCAAVVCSSQHSMVRAVTRQHAVLQAAVFLPLTCCQL